MPLLQPAPPLASVAAPPVAERTACRTPAAQLEFDFSGAGNLACTITGERHFTLLVTPEHIPPINPSPWYAFRYKAEGIAHLTVTMRYLGAQHRYSPKLRGDDGVWRELQAERGDNGTYAILRLPPGGGLVAAQEMILPANVLADLARWADMSGTEPFTLGGSHDGHAIAAIRLGRPDAQKLVVLIGRQHPPEVTGAVAMRAFVDALVTERQRSPEAFTDVQFLIVPMMNPDGVLRGHWRANRGGQDLNRDWGKFTQPETRAVKKWLDAVPTGVRPVLMVDFHSTSSNLFYVQGKNEASGSQREFLAYWLERQKDSLPGYPFTIEPRNANPQSGTAKNWFHETYGIPAYTYEVADDADRGATQIAAQEFAVTLAVALRILTD